VTKARRRFEVRQIQPRDFHWLKDFDCAPLTIERDSIYLFFCVHFRDTSFVAYDSESQRAVGFVLGFVPAGSSHAYVHYLFVEESIRKHGIGRALMGQFCDAAHNLGATTTCLYTIRESKFYQGLGFTHHCGPFDTSLARYVADVKGAHLMTATLPLSSPPVRYLCP